MPGLIMHVGVTAMCPHGAPMTVAPGEPRVVVSGMPVATLSDMYTYTGCVFQIPGPKPQPCVTTQWTTPATRVLANGKPVMLNTSVGLAMSAEQIPQGAPIVTAVQSRVTAI